MLPPVGESPHRLRQEHLAGLLAAAVARDDLVPPAHLRSDPTLPRFSIVMPSFNQAAYIEDSIVSVINQRYPNTELIVIDGGSTDGTVETIRRYGAYIAYWESMPDRGQSHALNKGFARATGDVFGWLNSDDLYFPGAFASAASAFRDCPTARIIFGDWLEFGEGSERLRPAFDFSTRHFLYEGFICNSQAMFWKKDVHHRFTAFDESLYNTMDYDMILRFGMNEGDRAFHRLGLPLAAFRRHPAQKTRGFGERVRSEHERIAARARRPEKFARLGRLARLYYRGRRGYWYLKRGGLAYALACLADSWRHSRAL